MYAEFAAMFSEALSAATATTDWAKTSNTFADFLGTFKDEGATANPPMDTIKKGTAPTTDIPSPDVSVSSGTKNKTFSLEARGIDSQLIEQQLSGSDIAQKHLVAKLVSGGAMNVEDYLPTQAKTGLASAPKPPELSTFLNS